METDRNRLVSPGIRIFRRGRGAGQYKHLTRSRPGHGPGVVVVVVVHALTAVFLNLGVAPTLDLKIDTKNLKNLK